MKDLTALAELKDKGGILERHFMLLKGHAISDNRRVDVHSLEGLRIVLRVNRMGALTEDEHTADVDSKVPKMLQTSYCVHVVGSSTASGPPTA